jgi:hypothetical protein
MKQPFVRLGVIIILTITGLFVARATAFLALAAQHGAQADGGYVVYLPAVFKPPCTDFSASAYLVASQPVLTVGETVTVTGALVNDGCARLGAPYFVSLPDPTAILSPSRNSIGYFVVIPPGGYQATSFAFQTIASGPVTVTFMASYEILEDSLPPGAIGGVAADPLIIRVLPISAQEESK